MNLLKESAPWPPAGLGAGVGRADGVVHLWNRPVLTYRTEALLLLFIISAVTVAVPAARWFHQHPLQSLFHHAQGARACLMRWRRRFRGKFWLWRRFLTGGRGGGLGDKDSRIIFNKLIPFYKGFYFSVGLLNHFNIKSSVLWCHFVYLVRRIHIRKNSCFGPAQQQGHVLTRPP